jgi:hypothetical protein
MEKLLKPHPGQKYADLVVCLQGDNEEDIECPPIRYYFGLWYYSVISLFVSLLLYCIYLIDTRILKILDIKNSIKKNTDARQSS